MRFIINETLYKFISIKKHLYLARCLKALSEVCPVRRFCTRPIHNVSSTSDVLNIRTLLGSESAKISTCALVPLKLSAYLNSLLKQGLLPLCLA